MERQNNNIQERVGIEWTQV